MHTHSWADTFPAVSGKTLNGQTFDHAVSLTTEIATNELWAKVKLLSHVCVLWLDHIAGKPTVHKKAAVQQAHTEAKHTHLVCISIALLILGYMSAHSVETLFL